jgi:hypothetical protein
VKTDFWGCAVRPMSICVHDSEPRPMAEKRRSQYQFQIENYYIEDIIIISENTSMFLYVGPSRCIAKLQVKMSGTHSKN